MTIWTSKMVNVFHKHASNLEQVKCPFQQVKLSSQQVKWLFQQVVVDALKKYVQDLQQVKCRFQQVKLSSQLVKWPFQQATIFYYIDCYIRPSTSERTFSTRGVVVWTSKTYIWTNKHLIGYTASDPRQVKEHFQQMNLAF